ncbi:MAG: YraN family protein [Paracoccus sp. (in: a-proteobacteria)]|nr:YraN family protein [Paracoccus sp. (in: a-proteobacteria)]
MAEDVAERHYRANGYELLERRWRGKGGEIDLIFRLGDAIIFVEVKASGDFLRAAERITRRQMDRICLAACEYCDDQPNGSLTEMRFDAALVDAKGCIDVIENAFGEN